MTVDEMTVDEMTVDEMTVDEMTVDEMTCCQINETAWMKFFYEWKSFLQISNEKVKKYETKKKTI